LQAAVQGLCDGLAMKLSRMGGVAPMNVFRDICAVRNRPHTCDDSWGGDTVPVACVHVAATVVPRRLDGVWIAQLPGKILVSGMKTAAAARSRSE